MARNGVQFNMWLSQEEKAKIQEKANKAGISMSEYIRRCALGRKIPQYGDVAVLREISAELGKIGSNLNQIAHHLNAGGSVYSVYYDLQEVIKDWNDMRFRMLKQVEDVCCGKYHHRRVHNGDYQAHTGKEQILFCSGGVSHLQI
jgi:predicted DNA-binding protein